MDERKDPKRRRSEKEDTHGGVPCRKNTATLHSRDGCLIEGYKELEEAYTIQTQMTEEAMSMVEQYKQIAEACKEIEQVKMENRKLKRRMETLFGGEKWGQSFFTHDNFDIANISIKTSIRNSLLEEQ